MFWLSGIQYLFFEFHIFLMKLKNERHSILMLLYMLGNYGSILLLAIQYIKKSKGASLRSLSVVKET